MADLTHRLVLGTMYFGTRTDDATARRLLDRFVAAGGDTLDTANCYAFWESGTGSGGQSEEVLGGWLRDNPGLRQQLVLATKVGQEPRVPGVFEAPWEGLSAEVVHRECERSMARLGVGFLDLYWAHGEDRSVPLEVTVRAFGELVADGSVRRTGLSNHPTWRVEQARLLAESADVEPFTALQLTTSYLHPRPGAPVPGKDHRFGFVTDETWDYLDEHRDLELWVYSPLVQGSYDRPERPFPEVYDHPGSTARRRALAEVAAEVGAREGQVVLAYLMHRSPQVRPIVGVSSVEQLDQALGAARVELSPQQVARLSDPV